MVNYVLAQYFLVKNLYLKMKFLADFKHFIFRNTSRMSRKDPKTRSTTWKEKKKHQQVSFVGVDE